MTEATGGTTSATINDTATRSVARVASRPAGRRDAAVAMAPAPEAHRNLVVLRTRRGTCFCLSNLEKAPSLSGTRDSRKRGRLSLRAGALTRDFHATLTRIDGRHSRRAALFIQILRPSCAPEKEKKPHSEHVNERRMKFHQQKLLYFSQLFVSFRY